MNNEKGRKKVCKDGKDKEAETLRLEQEKRKQRKCEVEPLRYCTVSMVQLCKNNTVNRVKIKDKTSILHHSVCLNTSILEIIIMIRT